MDAVIFDIDGTLANVEHRRPFLPDWDSFFGAMDRDTLNTDVANLFHMVWDSGREPRVFFCSGRPEKYRGVTEQWIEDNLNVASKFMDDQILMRADGDYRPDTVVKLQMLEHIRSQGFNVMFAVDDRKSVVDMWRENGVTCLQCAPGFDEEPKIITPVSGPPELGIMVGPAGAGKDTVISASFGQFAPDQIVSSDRIRELLCGDFRDQSRNREVFDIFHKLIRTKLECGISVIANATHIKTKDRLRTVENAFPDVSIAYIIVDRPLEEKIATGGWRNEVMIKDQTLVQKHHDVMHSNMKAILSGDGNPDTRIVDLRGEIMEGLTAVMMEQEDKAFMHVEEAPSDSPTE